MKVGLRLADALKVWLRTPQLINVLIVIGKEFSKPETSSK
jgi:hypothetical protein